MGGVASVPRVTQAASTSSVGAAAASPSASAAASLRAPLTDYARSRSCPVAVGAETMGVLDEAEAAAARARLAADMQE